MGSYVTAGHQPTEDRLAAVWEAPAPLFVYGSLMFPEVMRALIGRDPERTPAAVRGWSVVAIPGRVYPGLVSDGDAEVTGHLLTDLTEREWRVLDAFESDFYDLLSITTQTRACAWVYALRDTGPEFSHPWNSAEFEQDSLERYLISCGQWRQRFRFDEE